MICRPCRPCDSYNLNTSPLCNLTETGGTLYWAEDARNLYNETGEMPDYVSPLGGPMRNFYPGDKFKHEVLKLKNKEIAYNAFEKDIAILNLYFGKDTVPEYETNERMTVWDFISNIGGLLGLCAGVSILSCAEILYWFILRMFSN